MNKNVIVAYEKEFMAWCKGTPVLMGFPSSMHDASVNKLSWKPVTDFKDWSALDTKYIIDNEYSEFRKALCEGKTIQFKDLTEAWNDLKDPKFKDEPRHYRIKPEEPQFKEGDFVRYINSNNNKALKINNINCGFYYFDDTGMSLRIDEIIKWKPQAGELCWFTDTDSNVSVLAIFKGISEYRTFITKDNVRYDLCEPFLNSKPSWFKESSEELEQNIHPIALI